MLPESNPYRAVLREFESFPDSEKTALREWADHVPGTDSPPPELDVAQKMMAEFLRNLLVIKAEAPAVSSDAWPVQLDPSDPDNPAKMTFTNVGSLRALAKIAVRAAQEFPADQAAETYAAVAQLGRQQRAGLTLIEQLTGVVLENIAFDEAVSRLAEYSPEGLQNLARHWSTLHPAPSNAEALQGERDIFFLPYLENVIAPGLEALMTDPTAGENPDDPPGQEPDSEADAFSNLRLSGIVRIGPGEEQISLENEDTGETHTVRLGRPSDGFELIRIDFENHHARLRRNGHEAVINLRSKEIVTLDQSARKLREAYRGSDVLYGEGSGDNALAKTLELVRAHPEGVAGYLRDLKHAYQTNIDAQLALADSADAPTEDQPAAPTIDPMLAQSLPMIGRLARTLNNAATYPTMLQAAVHHRLAELGQAPAAAAPADPWAEDGAAFGLERTDDGGFILSSRYEVHSGAPLRVKFAAPDAGFVRPTSN